MSEYQVVFQKEIADGEKAVFSATLAHKKNKNKKTGVSKPIKPKKPMKDTGVSKSRRTNG